MTDCQGVSIELRKVCKRFGDAVALEDIDLEVQAGEFLALIGPSGCGKTTLLRLIAGLETPDSGSIAIDGTSADPLPPWQRRAPMVWQNHVLFPHLDVIGNVEFGLRMRRDGRRERRQRAHELLELLGIGALAQRQVHQLSGGQRQRVGIARALALRPPVLLLDEPLSALDPHAASLLRTELVRLHKQLGITFAYVTHSQSEALAMADRVAVLNHGRIEQVAAPATLFDAPATAFVASFVGMNNLIPGTTAHADGALQVIDTGLGPVAVAGSTHTRPGVPVTVVIPAHATRLTSPENDQVVVRGHVVDVEFIGAREVVHVAVNGTTIRAETPAGSHHVGYGDAVSLTWDPSAVHVIVDHDADAPAPHRCAPEPEMAL